jgi:putative membrane protein
VLPLWRGSDGPGHPKGQGDNHKVHRTTSPPAAPAAGQRTTPDEAATAAGTATTATAGKAGWFSGFNKSTPKPRSKDTFDPEKALPVIESDRPLLPARSPPPTTIFDVIPFLRILKPLITLLTPSRAAEKNRTVFGRKKQPNLVDSNVPLEITLFLSSYHAWLMRNGLLQAAIATAMMNNIAAFQDTMTNLERIKSTPLPFAYQAHLRMSLW